MSQINLELALDRIEVTTSYDGHTFNPIEIFDTYASSTHGLAHSQQPPRFSQSYGYGTDEQMYSDLGDDVHPVRHMLHTHDNIAVPFIAAQNASHRHVSFSETEEAELRFAAVVHDIGECMDEDVVQNVGFAFGDLKYGTHTVEQKLQEQKVREYLFGLYFSHMPEELLERVHEIDLRKLDDESRTTDAFNVIERFGYLTTAERARSIVHAEKDSGSHPGNHRIEQLGRLAIIVGDNHRDFIKSRSDDFALAELGPVL